MPKPMTEEQRLRDRAGRLWVRYWTSGDQRTRREAMQVEAQAARIGRATSSTRAQYREVRKVGG